MLVIDRSIALTIANRAWGVLAGSATLIFIAGYLAPIEQGFYYGITSMLGLQVFFELGLGFVVMQTASHIMANLRIENSEILGDAASLSRLGRLLADAVIWYSIACAAFIILVWFSGGWFLDRTPSSDMVQWKQTWIFVVPIFGVSILTNAIFSFLEGIGLVADIAGVRLIQAIVGMLCLWLMLFFGYKLMALVAQHLASLILASAWLILRQRGLLLYLFARRAAVGAINWRHEIWPFQWRIAGSWMAGYFGTQAVTLILFARVGPVGAGKFGFSLMAISAIAGGATAWVTTKSPRFGKLVAQSRFVELDTLYDRARKGALAIGILGSMTLLVGVIVLTWFHVAIADRFVPILGLAAMVLAMLANLSIAADATYLRAFRREPYLLLSLVIGGFQVLAAVLLSERGNIMPVVYSYAAINVGVGLIWARILFKRLRQEYVAI